jgi:signal transduction histidine kinase
MTKNLQFKISSGLKNIIGRDLITDDFIAVFELVKNAYDARARKVLITFEDDKIIIRDDGKGMSYDDLIDKWLFVAYSAKKEGIEDKKDESIIFNDYRDKIHSARLYAGAKGIGRFSCDKLGASLKLISKKATRNANFEQIVVNWDDFEEDPTKEFVKVNLKYSSPRTVVYPDFRHGTILEITNLRDSSWLRGKILDLKHSLEKLINPFSHLDKQKKVEDEFSIVIESSRDLHDDNIEDNQRDCVNGPVQNFVFETLNLKTTQIVTQIDEKGNYINTMLVDRGVPIYKIQEQNLTTPKLKNIELHLFHLNFAAKNNFKRQMGVEAVNFGSVFLFRNGFRVYPFGEVGEDTLGLDARKQQKVWERLGTRDVIGRIEIIDEHDDFKETSSRDGGLIKNAYYTQLSEIFLKKCLRRLENYVVDVNWQFKADKLREDLSELDNVDAKTKIISIISKLASAKEISLLYYNKDFLDIIQEKLAKTTPEVFKNLASVASKTNDASLLKEIARAEKKYYVFRETAEKAIQDVEETKAHVEEELELEKNKNIFLLATRQGISDQASGLIHNIKLSSTHINDEIQTLINLIKTNSIEKKELIQKLVLMKIHSDKVLTISRLITRANFKTDAAKQKVDVAKYFEQYISLYSDMYDKNTLKFEVINHNASFWTLASILELSIILDNLISNSTKAHASKVLVEMTNLKNENFKAIFSDNGTGVKQKYLNNIDRIFELGVTETDGSGIGLFTVRELLKKCKGTIRFLGNGVNLKGASFEISFGK